LLLAACDPLEPYVEPAAPPDPPHAPDAVENGWAAADRWAKDGHPEAKMGAGEEYSLFARDLCPPSRRWHPPERCGRPWYRSAVDAPATFAQKLAVRDDVVLTHSAVANLAIEHGAEPAVAVARELDAHERLWEAAMDAIASEGTRSRRGGGPLVAHEAWRHARARPASRAAALYVFAIVGDPQTCGPDCADTVDWEHFATWFGTPMEAGDFGAYLDHGPTAWQMAQTVCPALGRGWSRAEVVVPRLDALVGSAPNGEGSAHLRGVSGCLCDEHDVQTLGQMAAYFQHRGASDPLSYDARLAIELQASAKECRSRP
jgi:hypothetical protein